MTKAFLNKRHQHGATLIVSMLLLLIMTVLALSSSQSTRLQERMAGNARDVDIAFQGAESGLRGAETWLDNQLVRPDSSCTTAPCTIFDKNTLPVDLSNMGTSWWSTNGVSYGTLDSRTYRQPDRVVEYYAFVPDDLDTAALGRDFYRTTARGTGAAGGSANSTEVVVQSMFTHRYY